MPKIALEVTYLCFSISSFSEDSLSKYARTATVRLHDPVKEHDLVKFSVPGPSLESTAARLLVLYRSGAAWHLRVAAAPADGRCFDDVKDHWQAACEDEPLSDPGRRIESSVTQEPGRLVLAGVEKVVEATFIVGGSILIRVPQRAREGDIMEFLKPNLSTSI